MASNGDSGIVDRSSFIYDDVLLEEKPEGRAISRSEDNNNKDCENEHGSLIEDKTESSEQVSATNISSSMDIKMKTQSAELAASEGTVTLSENNFAESETENKGVTSSLHKGPVHDERNSEAENDGFDVPRKESDGDKRRTQKDCEKEFWMLRKTDPSKDSSIKKDDASQPVGDSLKEDSLESQPTKPPRRNPHKKQNTGNKETESEDAQLSTNEGDPIKPPRRRLPQVPKDPTLTKAESSKKTSPGEVSSDSYDAISPIKNDSLASENPQRDIICNPVLTSSPNQGEITGLSIESFNALDASHRVLSFVDVSSGGTIQKVESFYDYLYSTEKSEEVQSVSPVPQAGERIVSTLTDSEEHLYDSVPLEDSHSIGLDKKSCLMPYDEVMVNQEAYVMPSIDEDSDGFSDVSDPWGSDFEVEDDITDVGSLRTQDGGIDDEDPYDSVEISPVAERKRPLKFVSELTSFSPFPGMKKTPLGLKGQLKGCLGMSKAPSLPYLASDKKAFEEAAYVEPDITDSVNYQQAVMPPMPAGLSTEQIKRHQIVKFMLESEADYMRLLDLLSKQYELPIRERDLLEPNKIDTIFQHVHRVLQCHVMFNIALSDRMKDWTPQDKIGDVLYALFCKSMVLDAYSGYVNNFTRAMDVVKVACRTHLAFAQFLKARRQASREGHSLHHLMLKPIQRFPQILALLQELLLVTPKDHPDRCPLQLALTQLECLAESLKERKRESELRNKVKMLDALVAQSHKPLASGNRYFIRQDDFVQCVVEGESILGTKKRRIIMLSDMLLCVSLIKGKKDRAMHMITDSKAKYKLKWNVPLNDVDIVEYGPGVDVFTTFNKTTISHSKEGQYRKAYSGCQEHFEDLQQDLAIIGQIAGLVGTLRRSYQLLDLAKVQQWHRAVQRTIEEETKLANLYWLELSLPSKNDRVSYIFSTDSPTVKAEWVTAINTCKLRLAPENNPGWYLPEDDGTGGVAVQRRNMPLLKDNTNIFMMNQKAQVQGIVSCPDTSEPLPGVHDNYNNLWLLCSNGGNTGHVTVVSVSLTSPPRVVESFHVCESNILCGEYVDQTCVVEQKVKTSFTGRFGFPFPTVWLGTQGGRIFICNAVDSTRRYIMSVKLPDAVLDIKTVNGKIYAGIANGSVVVFKRNKDGVWNFSEPKAVSLGKMPVIAIASVGENLWCSSGNKIFIVDHDEEVVKQAIEIDENPKSTIKHVVSYGVGVWVSLWKLPSIKLFHSETLQHVQDISIASPVTKMQRDIDSQLEKTKLDKVYVTALVADDGLLWVGTSVGVTLMFPLPRLEGVPLVSGKACVAFHSYGDRLRCLYPLKNNPHHSAAGNRTLEDKPDFKLFRDHEVRDASVQTDPGISGAWSYAARGPALAENNRASPKKGGTSKKISAVRPIPNFGGGDQEEYSDEDVHSDDEFNFIEDGQTASTIPPSRSATASTGSFSVRFEPVEDPFKSLPSSVRSDDFVGKTDFRVDDFARMLSEFEGFGTSAPPTLPEAPRIPIIVTDEASTTGTSDCGERNEGGSVSSGQEGSNQSVTREKATEMVLEQGTANGSNTSGNATQTGSVDDFRSRVKSVGEYVKLTEARAAAEAQGLTLDQSKRSELKQETTPTPEVKPKPETQSQLGVTSTTSASYIEVLNESDPKAFKSPETVVKTPEVVYDSPRQDDSYSVFDRSERRESNISGTATIRKVENLKPRLPFPVLMVSAGEGYADLRRKRPDENDKESRIMIWQIS